MNLLIIGSTRDQRGGVETFCERAKQALEDTGRHRVDRIWSNSAYMNFKRLPLLFQGLREVMGYRNRGTDCVWLQYSSIVDLAYLAVAKLIGLKVVVTPHLGANWRSQSSPLLRTICVALLGLADRIALLSKTQEQEIRLPVKVPRCYIRTFLPATIWAHDLPAAPASGIPELRLVHAGRLSEGKGTFLFVDVCAKLRALGVPFAAVIAGGADDATMQQLQDMIARHELQNFITTTGFLENAALIKLLQDCDILVHLSKIDSYPLIVLESAAQAVFPICLDLAGAREMLATYGGHIVSVAGAVQETVDFLKEQKPDEIRAQSFAAASRVRADYAWSACIRALETALLSTASPRGIPEAQGAAS